jgi:uracil-DNA glycosylase family 4
MLVQKNFFIDTADLVKERQAQPKIRSSSGRRASKPRQTKVFDCTSCGLDKFCNYPDMPPYGEGKKGILIIALCPGKEEDRSGVPLTGPSGKLTRKALAFSDIDIDVDCVRTNVVRCRPEMDKRGSVTKPTAEQIKCCRSKLESVIQEVKPKLILCLGGEAINEIFDTDKLGKTSVTKMHGRVFPSRRYNCWVGCALHPSFVLRETEAEELIYFVDVANAIAHLDKELPPLLTPEGNILVSDATDAKDIIESFVASKEPVTFDYETTGVSPYEEGAKTLTVSLSSTPNEGFCIPLGMNNWSTIEQAFVEEAFIKFLKSSVPKVGQNYTFEEIWSRVIYKTSVNNYIYDTMIGSHVIHSVKGTNSLEFQVYCSTGFTYKKMVDHNNLINTDLQILSDYNNYDTRFQIMLYYEQQKQLFEDTRKFNLFLLNSLPTLVKMSLRGIPIDKDELCLIRDKATVQMDECVLKLHELSCVKKLVEKKQAPFNIRSNPQKVAILYDILGCSAKKGTSVAEESLVEILNSTKDVEVKEFIELCLEYTKYESLVKVTNTYAKCLKPDGRVHPTYNLHTAESYRSSASDPNTHNMPKRNDYLKQFRRCVVPSSKRRKLYEVDHKGSEARVIAMVSGDKNLIKDVLHSDPHRKWASIIYEKKFEDVTSEERFVAKNSFVFASFYGAEPKSIAKSFGMKERHFIRVQERFWSEYQDVKRWQQENLEFYRTHGYIKAATGFRRYGPLSVNMVLNTPIQGTSFHLLLDGLVRVDQELERRGLLSEPINQVHDSIIFDMESSEAEEVVDLTTRILRSVRFDWQRGIEMDVDWVCGSNLLDMQPFTI